jgi:hypothetical protein
VAQSLGLGLGTISSVLAWARATGLNWPQAQALTDEGLESRLYGRPDVAGQRQRPAPDCAWIHAERRKPGVTLGLLHLEYLERHPDGYRYTRLVCSPIFCSSAPGPPVGVEDPGRRRVLREWFPANDLERFLLRCDHLSAKFLLSLTQRSSYTLKPKPPSLTRQV